MYNLVACQKLILILFLLERPKGLGFLIIIYEYPQ